MGTGPSARLLKTRKCLSSGGQAALLGGGPDRFGQSAGRPGEACSVWSEQLVP